jgi:hypothetical protein
MILAKSPAAADPRNRADLNSVIPNQLQLIGTIRLQRTISRIHAANPPLDLYGRQLNPSAEPFPYYVDAAIVRGLRAIVRRHFG